MYFTVWCLFRCHYIRMIFVVVIIILTMISTCAYITKTTTTKNHKKKITKKNCNMNMYCSFDIYNIIKWTQLCHIWHIWFSNLFIITCKLTIHNKPIFNKFKFHQHHISIVRFGKLLFFILDWFLTMLLSLSENLLLSVITHWHHSYSQIRIRI